MTLDADRELKQKFASLFYDDNYEYMLENPDMFDVGAIDEAVEFVKAHTETKVKETIGSIQKKFVFGEDLGGEISVYQLSEFLNQLTEEQNG